MRILSSFRYISSASINAIVIMALLCTGSDAQAEEVIKWVDENGRVHFGDAPPKSAAKTETITVKEAPKQGLTEEELRAREAKVQEYKRQLELKRDTERYSQEYQDKANKKEENTSTTEEQSRANCRAQYPSNTLNRVKCFREVEEKQAMY